MNTKIWPGGFGNMNVDQTIQGALKHGFSSVKFANCVINLCYTSMRLVYCRFKQPPMNAGFTDSLFWRSWWNLPFAKRLSPQTDVSPPWVFGTSRRIETRFIAYAILSTIGKLIITGCPNLPCREHNKKLRISGAAFFHWKEHRPAHMMASHLCLKWAAMWSLMASLPFTLTSLISPLYAWIPPPSRKCRTLR